MKAELFWVKVAAGGEDECWLWPGAPDNTGYGRAPHDGKKDLAHRVAYVLSFGAVPEGLVVSHIESCANKMCCNPRHLEAVTQREANLRSAAIPSTVNARKTRCIHGHEFNEENTIIRSDRRPGRDCRACRQRRIETKRARTALNS